MEVNYIEYENMTLKTNCCRDGRSNEESCKVGCGIDSGGEESGVRGLQERHWR
jgi:hypothetical protein